MKEIPVVSPIVAAITAVIVDVGAALVTFGVFDNTTASAVVTVALSLVSAAAVIANSLNHKTNAVIASK